MFYRNTEKKNLHRNSGNCPDVREAVGIMKKQKKQVALFMKRSEIREKDFQHKLSAGLAKELRCSMRGRPGSERDGRRTSFWKRRT